MSREERVKVIESLEAARGSKVIAYVCGDRPGAGSKIGNDAVRPLYDHLLGLGHRPQIDLFIYSLGGAVDVPWRMVTMIREFCDRFAVIVPYKAHSAATLLALGADEIVLGRKGELGPIDPSLNMETEAQAVEISVEDVMAYVEFARQRTGLTDQTGLAAALSQLAEKVGPVVLGSIYRQHSHIRSVARKMLASHRQAVDEQKMSVIVETLAERVYAHGHAISRVEAREIGLPLVEQIDDELERRIWSLYTLYEADLSLNEPIDESFLGGNDEAEADVVMAMIESTWGLHDFGGRLNMRVVRQNPPQINATLNLNLQMPPNVPVDQIPQQAQQVLQLIVQQAQQAAQVEIERAIRSQAPVVGINSRLRDARWRRRDVTISIESKPEREADAEVR